MSVAALERDDVAIEATAVIAESATVGQGTHIWHLTQVREGARIGRQCNLGKNVYVGAGVVIGDRCKVENNASLFEGVRLEDGVFVGPNAIFANDPFPRAINPDGTLQGPGDWAIVTSVVRYGASVGAGAIVLPGCMVGTHALIGAGTLVTRDVPDFGVVVGNPGRLIGYTCRCGRRRTRAFEPGTDGAQTCERCAGA